MYLDAQNNQLSLYTDVSVSIIVVVDKAFFSGDDYLSSKNLSPRFSSPMKLLTTNPLRFLFLLPEMKFTLLQLRVAKVLIAFPSVLKRPIYSQRYF